MNREAVFPNGDQRAVAEIVRSLGKRRVPLAVSSMDRVHLHATVQVIDGDPRHWVGLATKGRSASLRRDGLAPSGGL